MGDFWGDNGWERYIEDASDDEDGMMVARWEVP